MKYVVDHISKDKLYPIFWDDNEQDVYNYVKNGYVVTRRRLGKTAFDVIYAGSRSLAYDYFSYEFQELLYRVAIENMNDAISDPFTAKQIEFIKEYKGFRSQPSSFIDEKETGRIHIDTLVKEITNGEICFIYGDKYERSLFETKEEYDKIRKEKEWDKSIDGLFVKVGAYDVVGYEDILSIYSKESNLRENPDNHTPCENFSMTLLINMKSSEICDYTGKGNKVIKLQDQYFIGPVTTVGALSNDRYNDEVEEVILPDSIIELGNGAFSKMRALKKVTNFPKTGVVSSMCFSEASSLESFDFSEISEIGSSAFSQCTLLDNVDLTKVNDIGSYAFSYCGNLKNIKLPIGITKLSDGLFLGCSALEHIELPSSLLEIGDATFDECNSLTEITFPEGLTTIGNTFRNCSSLKRVVLSSTLTTVSPGAFEGSPVSDVVVPDGLDTSGFVFMDEINAAASQAAYEEEQRKAEEERLASVKEQEDAQAAEEARYEQMMAEAEAAKAAAIAKQQSSMSGIMGNLQNAMQAAANNNPEQTPGAFAGIPGMPAGVTGMPTGIPGMPDLAAMFSPQLEVSEVETKGETVEFGAPETEAEVETVESEESETEAEVETVESEESETEAEVEAVELEETEDEIEAKTVESEESETEAEAETVESEESETEAEVETVESEESETEPEIEENQIEPKEEITEPVDTDEGTVTEPENMDEEKECMFDVIGFPTNNTGKKVDLSIGLTLSIGEQGNSYIAFMCPANIIDLEVTDDEIPAIITGNSLCVAYNGELVKRNLFTNENVGKEIPQQMVESINKSIEKQSIRNDLLFKERAELNEVLNAILCLCDNAEGMDMLNNKLNDIGSDIYISIENGSHIVKDIDDIAHSLQEVLWALSFA